MTTTPSRRALRRVAVVLTASLAVLAAACVPEAPAPTTTTTTPASPEQVARQQAAAWLDAQFTEDHWFPGPFNSAQPDAANAAQAIADLHVLGVGAGDEAARLARLEADTPGAIDDGTGGVAGVLARIILAVVATGGDPRDFAGTDLVARLEGTIQADGRFGVQSPLYDGAYRQGLALAALSTVTPRPASITPAAGGSIEDLPAVAWLIDQQCADGAWMAFRADTSTDCVEDPASWTYKDSNGAAMAALGLVAVGATAPVDPTAWLLSVRGTDGGWGAFPPGPSTPSDANSTALVIAALEALGETPDAAALEALRSFQLGASAPAAAQGAFFYQSWDTSPSSLATLDAVAALLDEPWPQALVP
ncbi:hypothetical protein [Dermatobacter hominis]|uniref:hypothetical protein n=1 Tax=Dermatobacter hominis TaxID=2884263 RepID=UPI001D10D51A|nr:hypothetical protein [Dermatobacter hominis]UDY36174.1 hypothetical protein LH044_01240 [Dermatobacter hominis]